MSQFHMTAIQAAQSETTPSALDIVILLITTYHKRLLAVWVIFCRKKKGFSPQPVGEKEADGWCVMGGEADNPVLFCVAQ